MKKLFIVILLIGVSNGMAKAQDKTATTPTKIESKERLKKAEAQPMKVESAKIDQRAANVKRIDGNNTKGVVLTEEQMKARTAEKAATAEPKVK